MAAASLLAPLMLAGPASAVVDLIPPKVIAVTPLDAATVVDMGIVPTVTFSEAVQTATIIFTLTGPSGRVPGTVAYDAVNHVARFAPTALLTIAKYTAKVWGAKDLHANTMTSTKVWSFSTGTGPDTQAPSVPGAPVATGVTTSAAVLTWPASTDTVGVTKYDLYNGSALLTSVAGNPPVATVTLAGLADTTKYSITVQALDAAGNASGSSPVTVFTTLSPPPAPDTQKPTAPVVVAAPVAEITTAIISWLPSTDNVGVVAYQVTGGVAPVLINDSPLSVTATLEGLTQSTSYTVTVKAVDAAGNVSDASNPVTFTTSKPIPVNLITNPSVETGTTTPDGWQPYVDNGTDATMTYETSGALDGNRMLTVKNNTAGLAFWRTTVPQQVTAGATYTYQDSYRSDVTSYLEARYLDSTGVLVADKFIGYVNASSLVDNLTGVAPTNPMEAYNWERMNIAVTVPAGAATQVELQRYIYSPGTLQTDVFSLTLGAPVPLPPLPSGTELVHNRGAETISGTTPVGWTPNSWGTSTSAATFSVSTSDVHSGSKALKVVVTGDLGAPGVDGDAKWDYVAGPAVGGRYYKFSDWYKSDASTSISVGYTRAAAPDAVVWANLGAGIAPATAWTQYSTGFLLPLDAVTVFFAHFIPGNGTLLTDDYSMMQTDNPQGFNRPLISLTFDDGSTTQYDALPVAEQYGFKTTQYVPTGELGVSGSGMWTKAQLLSVFDRGHEIGGHTVTHPNLTCTGPADPCLGSVGHNLSLAQELSQSKATLGTLLGPTRIAAHPVVSFASPFGSYNSDVLTALGRGAVPAGSNLYQNQRSVEQGYNGKSDTDTWDIRVQNMLVTTTLAEVQSWIDTAMHNNYWLVIVYHEITAITTGDPEDAYATSPENFAGQMLEVHNSGVQVLTVRDALAEVQPQCVSVGCLK